MSSEAMQRITLGFGMRHDHTKWLMHFVRDRVPEQDFPGQTEEEYMYHAGGELEQDASAFEVLSAIIRLGGLRPGHSFRSGRTTIYGGQPALCVTEMPLYSFADYARSSNNTGRVSAYGIAVLKSEFYSAGGRPAIYGLSTSDVRMVQNDSYVRILPDSVLPKAEQYRYVAYNPSSKTAWIDWSHEREWRWIARDEDTDQIWVQDHNQVIGPVPALPLFKGKLEGDSPFTQVCVIVWTREEAAEIQEIFTGMYLAENNNYGTVFDRNVIAASKIIILSDVIEAVEAGKQLEAQTIEGLDAADLVESVVIPDEPPDAEKRAKHAFDLAEKAAASAQAEFRAKHGRGNGFCGFAHPTTTDVTNPMVQYLLAKGMASGPFDGRVWIDIPMEAEQSLDFAMAGCEAAAKSLNESLGIAVYVESRYD